MHGLCQIALYNGHSQISRWIERLTFARGDEAFSHAAILLPDGNTISESYEGVGVRQRPLDDPEFDSSDLVVFDVRGVTAAGWAKAIAWSKPEMGCEYDYRGVGHFLSGQQGRNPWKWWCSEYGFEFVAHAGLRLLRGEGWQMSPKDLGLSPYISEAWRRHGKRKKVNK
jgi:uncharacterized protein YycO